jgi:hypothetical protein
MLVSGVVVAAVADAGPVGDKRRNGLNISRKMKMMGSSNNTVVGWLRSHSISRLFIF